MIIALRKTDDSLYDEEFVQLYHLKLDATILPKAGEICCHP